MTKSTSSFLLSLVLLSIGNIVPIECANKILDIAKPAVDNIVDGNTHSQQQLEQSPVHNPICRLPKHRGNVCAPSSAFPPVTNSTMGVKVKIYYTVSLLHSIVCFAVVF